MKKFTLALLCVIFLLSATLGFVACTEEHKHTFTEEKAEPQYLAAEATCTEPAKYYYSCTCGEKGTETFASGNALNHSFTNYVSDGNATCTADGTKTAKCDRCDETDTIADVGSKLPHTFDKQVATEQYLASAATCTQAATYYYSCACGEKGTDAFEFGNALNHSFTNYVSDNNATCTADGTKTAKCDRCNETDTIADVGTKLEHLYSSVWSYDETFHWHAATCEHTDEVSNKAEHEFENKVCKTCGYIKLASKGLSFWLNIDKTSYSVSGEYCQDSDIVIPRVYGGVPVTSIRKMAFSNCCNLTSIELPDSITTIGDYAFSDCTSLNKIIIPNSVTSIGEHAFNNCSGLNEIIIPNSVTSIGNSAFSGCSGLKRMTLPFVGGSRKTSTDTYQYPFGYIFGTSSYDGGVATKQYYPSTGNNLDHNTFYIPSWLKSVTITGGEILYGAFAGCFLRSIEIPDSITTIGDYAFSNCISLRKITIPDSVTSIGKYAFNNCCWLNEIIIPNGVTSIGNSAFSGCSWLNEIIIPNGVMSIGWSAFSNCKYLTKVIWNAENCEIDSNHDYPIFKDCSRLSQVTIGENVKSMPSFAFYDCDALASIIWNAENCTSAGSLGHPIFTWGPKLKTITIGDNVKTIPSYAFHDCRYVTSITIPNGVTSIGDAAFEGCTRLTSVIWNAENCTYAGGSIDSVKRIFANCPDIATVTIGDNVKTIPPYAFQYCRGLTSIEIPNSVTTIGGCAFVECSDLANVIIGAGVTSIGSLAFYRCHALRSIDIPDSVTSIGSYAFSNTGLKRVIIPDGIIFIGEYAFNGCGLLTYVNIGKGVTSISNATFFRCGGLTSIKIPSSVTTIEKFAFYNCSGLRSITIPDSVTSIGEYAFSGCSGLTSVTIPDSVTSIGEYAFSECSILKEIHFTGTKAQWDAISKGNNWINDASKCTVYCSDDTTNK